MKTITKLFFSIMFICIGYVAVAQWTGTGPVQTSDQAIINRSGESLRLNGAAPWMSFYASGVLNGWVFHDGLGMEVMNNDAGELRLGTSGADRVTIRTNGEVDILKTGIALRCAGAEALWSDGDNFSWGFGKDYSYWANEMVIGQSLIPNEGDGLTIGNNEDLRFEGTGSKYLRFTESGSQRGVIGHDGLNVLVQSDEAASIVELDGQTGIEFRLNNNEKMSIESNGDVAIHDLVDVLFKDATGTNQFNIDYTTSFIELDANGGNRSVGLDCSGTGSVYFNNDGARMATFTDDGYLGIGTTTPDKELVVVGQGRIRNTAAGANYIYERTDRSAFAMGAGGQVGLNFDNNYNFELRSGLRANVLDGQLTNGTSRFKIQGSNGYCGIGTFSPNTRLHVNGSITYNGSLINGSDRRLKKNIAEFALGLDELRQLNPVTYQYNGEAEIETAETHIGMIAQELQKVAPEMVTEFTYEKEENGRSLGTEDFLAIKESSIKYLLINSMKELADDNDAKDERIEELETELASMKEAIAQIQAQLAGGKVDAKEAQDVSLGTTGTVAELAQNHPNPFNENTMINYFLPEGSTGAHMNIFSQDGKVLKTIKIDEAGQGQINLKANSLPAGSYMYQLVTDTGVVGTKTMVLAK